MAVVALLTDFGTHDPYVGSMKGVIASRCTAAVLDLTHEIAPFDVFGAAWYLRTVAPDFTGEAARPAVFVCVVDPGVGSGRRILLMQSAHQYFLAPDNGLLSLLPTEGTKMFSVENSGHFLPGGSSTFHGRDRFAPVAAALASGTVAEEFGPRVDLQTMVRLPYQPPSYAEQAATGTVVAVDRFGNLITDIVASRLPAAGSVVIAGHHIVQRAEHYSGGTSGAFFLVGSSGAIEISVAGGSAAEMLQAARFDPVEVRVVS